MKKWFVPDAYIKSFQYVNFVKLREKGIRLLACDIDNTLVAHDQPHPNQEVIQFFNQVEKHGFEVILVSNNVKERVSLFSQNFNIKTYPLAWKPLKKTYRKILNDHPYQPHEIAVLGDQLLTDILGAHRMGFYTILTDPVVQRDLKWTKINRVVEIFIYKWLRMRGSLRKGEYYE